MVVSPIRGGDKSHRIAIDTKRVVTRATRVLMTAIGHVSCYEPEGKFCDGEGKINQQF